MKLPERIVYLLIIIGITALLLSQGILGRFHPVCPDFRQHDAIIASFVRQIQSANKRGATDEVFRVASDLRDFVNEH